MSPTSTLTGLLLWHSKYTKLNVVPIIYAFATLDDLDRRQALQSRRSSQDQRGLQSRQLPRRNSDAEESGPLLSSLSITGTQPTQDSVQSRSSARSSRAADQRPTHQSEVGVATPDPSHIPFHLRRVASSGVLDPTVSLREGSNIFGSSQSGCVILLLLVLLH